MAGKPKFNPNQPYQIADKPKFDPSQPFSEGAPVEGPSELESGIRGLAQGGSFGFADEVTGALEAGKDLALDPSVRISNVLDQYSKHRDESRRAYHEAEAANPGSYLAGEVTGGIASSLIPVAGAVGKGAGLAARVGQGVLAGGRVGALTGLGASEGQDLSEVIRDTGKGAATGAALGGVAPIVTEKIIAPVAGAAVQRGNQLLQKAIRGATDTSEEMVTRAQVAGGSQAIKSAPTVTQNTQNLLERIKNLKERSIEGSKASREILRSENVVLPKTKITGAIDAEIESIKSGGAFTDEVDKTLNRLERLKDKVNKTDGELSGEHVKTLIQQIEDYAYKGSQGAADFGSQDVNSFKGLRRAFDSELKGQSPAYAEQMKNVAKDSDLINKAKAAGRDPQAAVKNQMSNNPKDKTAEVFKGLGLAEDVEQSKLNKYFNANTTNGSKKTMAGATIGGAVGWILGPLGSAAGGAAGAAAGGALDKSGRMLALKAAELGALLEPKALSLGKYAKPLAEAAARGPAALIMTHQMLSKDPVYQAALQEGN
jgi:gas vesicle protein